MRSSRLLWLTMLPLLVTLAAGCRDRGTVSTNTGDGSTSAASADDLLKSAVHQLRPENFSIAAASDKPINLLNSWRAIALGEASTPPAIPAGWADDAEAARLKAENFDARDAVHIRDAMLTHTIAAYLAERAGDEVTQVRMIFDSLVRNIALPGADVPDIPLGIYEILLLGRGLPEDRAWACAALLKQRRIDCVIVRPSEDAGAEPDAWLLGVLLNGQVYLFDPRLGIPVPSTAETSPAATAPATLAEIVNHPEWLAQLAIRADQPYPIAAEMLKQPAIQPIVAADFWSPRMRHLESVLPADDVCVLYDPLADGPEQSGLLSRLRHINDQWTAERLKPWPYPRMRTLAAEKLARQRQSQPDKAIAAMEPWEAVDPSLSLPFPVHVDKETQAVALGVPERRLLRIRTDQLLGKFEDATRRYLAIRHLEVEPTPVQQLALLNRLGAENAIYWTAVCKFESGEYGAAIEQLTGYLDRYERNGRWNFAARALLADCHAAQGQFKEAAAVLERSRSDDPYRAGNAVRIKRWKAE